MVAELVVFAVTRRYKRPPKARMVVADGRIVGWQRGEQFIPIGSPCCPNPLACRKCFGPRGPWWAPWRR